VNGRRQRIVIVGGREGDQGGSVDFVSALMVLARHWLVVLNGVVLTVGATLALFVAVPPTYQATTSAVLLVPSQPGATETGQLNPYLGFGGSLGIVAEITARRMNDGSMVDKLVGQGATADYLVDLVPGDAPILSVTATSRDEQAALRTARIVDAAVSAELRDSQLSLGAPANLLISTKPVTTATRAVLKRGSQIRAVAAVMVLGIAGTIVAAFIAEGVRVRRARMRADPGHFDRRRKPRQRADDPPVDDHGLDQPTEAMPALHTAAARGSSRVES
jgi:capsular polysaccharide biosynthesis protein